MDPSHPKMIKVLQINVRNCRAAQDLVCATADQEQVDVVLLSEQYGHRNDEDGWFSDQGGLSAVVIVNNKIIVDGVGPNERGFIWLQI